MLTIRRQQLEVLRAAAESSFRDSLAEELRAAGWTDERTGMRGVVEALLARAASYGVFLRDDQVRFIGLAARRGETFDLEPWAAAILRDPYRSGSDKLTALETLAAEEG
ncbi:MAG TPA: hypothetical protein VGQ36_18115 [Thermoanaerobaculia bacterium]|jgi:hypothetical protein|nr:hypothetical protein [Thermoanaerobaculia bacterium]